MGRWLSLMLALVPCASFAQQRLGPAELARARSELELHKAELSGEQYALLSTKLAQTQEAYEVFVAVGGETMAVAAEAGGSAVLSTVAADVLPFLAFVWPSTANAPGMKDEKPQVRAARGKLEQRVKELAQATQRVQAEVAKRPARATGSGADKGVQCRLDGSGGGFRQKRPGRCKYECNDGRRLCKLVRVQNPGCPVGLSDQGWFPISDLDNLENCP